MTSAAQETHNGERKLETSTLFQAAAATSSAVRAPYKWCWRKWGWLAINRTSPNKKLPCQHFPWRQWLSAVCQDPACL